MGSEPTPMMKQYQQFKQDHPDSILLFRMGDFYETFYDDAKTASQILGLTLTKRNNGKADEIPLAGLPYHALDTYLARLVRAGRKVAICEQMEPPQKGKKLVRREVVQVVSPGTILAEDLLDHKRNNYLAGVFEEDGRVGVAIADVSTGTFRVQECAVKDLWEVLSRLDPSEVVAGTAWCETNASVFAERLEGVLLTQCDDWSFSPTYAYDTLNQHFQTKSLKGFGIEEMTVGVGAAGGVLSYLKTNQRGAIPHITSVKVDSQETTMTLDLVTQRNLELVSSIQEGRREGTLLSVIDQTRTAPGARMLREWLFHPLTQVAAIERRLDSVEELANQERLRGDLRQALKSVGDIERIISKVCCGRATPRDLGVLRTSLSEIPPVLSHLEEATSDLLVEIRSTGFPDLSEVQTALEKTLVDEPPIQLADGGLVRPGCHDELDELRDAATGGREWMAGLQTRERESTGIPSLKVNYNRAFGYYIEVTRANLDKVPEAYERKQTLVNAERFITKDLKDWEAKILGADERSKALERDIFLKLRDDVAAWVAPIQETAQSIATLDVLCSFGEVSRAQTFVRPAVDEGLAVEITAGRHPVIETLLPAGSFVANDVTVDGEKDQILIITGPNMAGKSTVLRLTGLIVLLAQVGCFVPAQAARIGIADRIFTRVGASDNLARGESTFLVEMNEAANILNNATARSVVLLDEIGRGTSTFDGLSIAWAMTEYLHNSDVRPRTLFATHYHELTELEELLPRVRNFSVAVKERGDDIVFLHTLVPGGCDHSYGIQVARLAGMPSSLIENAKRVLHRLEQNDLSLVQSATRRSRKSTNGQISLFEMGGDSVANHPVLDTLESLNVDEMTPVEALVRLEAMKRELGERETD
jgi:DNA mismatch repair protein MutS